eukprot:2830430-Rhodomonas_salina.1
MSACSTYPLTLANVALSMLCPLTSSSPETFPVFLRPAMTSISVDFPAPEEPISAVMVPGTKIAETSFSSNLSSVSFLPLTGTLTVYESCLRLSVIGSGWTESERSVSYGPSKLPMPEASSSKAAAEADFKNSSDGSRSNGDFFFKLAGCSENVLFFSFLTTIGLESPKRL